MNMHKLLQMFTHLNYMECMRLVCVCVIKVLFLLLLVGPLQGRINPIPDGSKSSWPTTSATEASRARTVSKAS